MKKQLYYLLLTPIIFSTIGCGSTAASEGGSSVSSSTPKPVDVVIISGQSNGVGCTHSEYLPDSLGKEKYNEYFTGYNSIQIAYDCWTKDWPTPTSVTFYSQNLSRKNNFVKVTLGQGNNYTTFGPEVGIAESLHEKYGSKLFLIKYACGGSNLQEDWLGKRSPMYPRLINYVKLQINNLIDKGYSPTIKAFCWMQGEGDSYPGLYKNYLSNLRTFVSDLRDDLKDYTNNEKMAFIDAGISNASVWEYYKEVNDAKLEFSKEDDKNIFIDTIASGLHTDQEPPSEPDIYHYDSASEIELGHLFAEAIEPFLSK